MKKLVYSIVLTSLLSPLYATQVAEDEYLIMLGAYTSYTYAEETVESVPLHNASIVEKTKNKKPYYYAVIDYIKSKSKAKKELKSIQKKIKDAYIIKKKKSTPDINDLDILQLPTLVAQSTPVVSDAYHDNNETTTIAVHIQEEVVKKEDKKTISLTKPKVTAETLTENDLTIDGEHGISLKEAILLSLKKSYKISAAREKVIQAKRKVDEKLAPYKPTLNLSTNAGGAYLSPYKASEEKFLKSDESLVLNQNIYAGGKHVNEIKREKAKLLAAQEKFQDIVEEETIKVIDAYLSLIYQKMAIKITRDNMLSLKKILDIVTIKEREGASSKGDLNYIKSQVENASAALVKSESKYQNAIAFYEYYVGELNDSNRPVEYTFEFALEDEQSILQMMRQNNAKLLIAKAKMDAEKHNLRAQKSKFHPSIDFSITAKDKQSGYISEPQEDRVTGLISLNYNIYNGGKDKAILLGTKSKISELQYKLIDIQEGSEYNTKQLYENILSSMDALKHTENEVKANKKVIDSYWAAFKYGTQDIQALLLAQRALNRSQQDVIKEKQAYTNGYFKLMQQTGTLLKTLGLEDFTNADKIIQDKSLNYYY